MEIEVPPSWTGKTILELNVRSQYGLNIIAIRRNESLCVELTPSFTLEEGDILILIGSNKNLSKLQKLK